MNYLVTYLLRGLCKVYCDVSIILAPSTLEVYSYANVIQNIHALNTTNILNFKFVFLDLEVLLNLH